MVFEWVHSKASFDLGRPAVFVFPANLQPVWTEKAPSRGSEQKPAWGAPYHPLEKLINCYQPQEPKTTNFPELVLTFVCTQHPFL